MRQTSLQPIIFALLALVLLFFSTAWLNVGLLLGLAAVWLPGLGWLTWLAIGERWQEQRPLPWVEPLLALLLTIGGAGSMVAAVVLSKIASTTTDLPLVGTAAVPLVGTTAVPFVAAYLGVIGLLLVWDLSRFRHRLDDATTARQQRALLVGHARPLLLLVVLALLALAAVEFVPLSFNFDWALVSALVLVFGLSFLLRLVRDEIN